MNDTSEKKARVRLRKIPEALVYELMDGQPIYYKGYKSVLNRSKTIDDIMGCSSLQAEIISYFLELFFSNINKKEYRIYTNEIGLHLDKGNNLAGNICIFRKSEMTADKIDNHYINIPAQLQIEIDVKGEIPYASHQKYLADKTNKLLKFGTSKIIWILTDSRQVMVAETGKDWLIFNWDKTFETINGITANIGQHLIDNGVNIL